MGAFDDFPVLPGREEVTLTGSALYGVGPARLRSLYEQLPRTVRLGRIRPAARPPALRFAAFFDPARATPPPVSVNRRDKAAAALSRVYKNAELGCCVISGKGHLFGLLAGAESGIDLEMTDDEVVQQYEAICGPDDQGCVITQVLDVCRASGFRMGGKLHKIDGYVSADWRSKLETQTVQYLFGAGTVGINLPQAWTENDVWDVTGTAIVGGHDVTPIDYDEKGVYVSSWGRIYLITWPAWTSTRWLEEYYAVLAPEWYAQANLAPSGLDVGGLKQALTQLGGGTIPPIPGPLPPGPNPPPQPPPMPPPPDAPTIVLSQPVRAGQRVVFASAKPAGTYVRQSGQEEEITAE